MTRLIMHQVVDLKGGTEKKEQPTQDLESFTTFQSSA